MFVVFLIAFKCMLTNKLVLGTNLGQRGSKPGFLKGKVMGSQEGNPRIGLLLRVAQYRTPCFGCSVCLGVDPDFTKWFFWWI